MYVCMYVSGNAGNVLLNTISSKFSKKKKILILKYEKRKPQTTTKSIQII